MRWLLDWQHVAPGTQLSGEQGTLEVLQQLQGFEAPANAWEPQILARRIARLRSGRARSALPDGVVGWGRLSPHPATLERRGSRARDAVMPTSVAPVTFFVREDADWMAARRQTRSRGRRARLSRNARDVFDYLGAAGASFFADI